MLGTLPAMQRVLSSHNFLGTLVQLENQSSGCGENRHGVNCWT